MKDIKILLKLLFSIEYPRIGILRIFSGKMQSKLLNDEEAISDLSMIICIVFFFLFMFLGIIFKSPVFLILTVHLFLMVVLHPEELDTYNDVDIIKFTFLYPRIFCSKLLTFISYMVNKKSIIDYNDPMVIRMLKLKKIRKKM